MISRHHATHSPGPTRRTPGVILLHKPYGVVCRFSDDGSGRPTLAAFVPVSDVYPAGRLDTDSEGLVVLTADGALQARIAHPRHQLTKVYWVEVEGVPDDQALDRLRGGVPLREFTTAAAGAERLATAPTIGAREPPIRVRRGIPTTWLRIGIHEGRNRQVRRMTAAVGHPTLRLIRVAVGPWSLAGLAPGAWRHEAAATRML